MKLAAMLIALAIPAAAETPCDAAKAAFALTSEMHTAMQQSQLATIENLTEMMQQKPPQAAMRESLLASFEAAKKSAVAGLAFAPRLTALATKIGTACP